MKLKIINWNWRYLIIKELKFLPDNLKGNPPPRGSGANGLGPNGKWWKPCCLVFDLGSLGPSTVTLIALLYVATCGGVVETIIVNVKLFPAITVLLEKKKLLRIVKVNVKNWFFFRL